MNSRLLAALSGVLLASGTAACSAEPSAAGKAQGSGYQPQLRPVPNCEGCEAALERNPATLKATIRLGPGNEPGAPLILEGTVYRPDRRTPAPGVVLYLHQTNAQGRYANGSRESEWSSRHGRLRGWLKTDPDGRYRVLTVRPGGYPGRPDPAHIHLTVWEPGKDPYWIDDVVFDDDPRTTEAYRRARQNRGGSGIGHPRQDAQGRWVVSRDIILER